MKIEDLYHEYTEQQKLYRNEKDKLERTIITRRLEMLEDKLTSKLPEGKCYLLNEQQALVNCEGMFEIFEITK